MSALDSPSKFDICLNPVYQVDWHQEAAGKRMSASKRRVRFRFGFSHRESIEQGRFGVDCRGEEHEVVLVWSLTSGKRLVLADGQEIHFSKGKVTETSFETTWSIAGGHMIKLIAHAAGPLFHTPGFRQFDLQIDGLSFFDMPKIFELGTTEAVHFSTRKPTSQASYLSLAGPIPSSSSYGTFTTIEHPAQPLSSDIPAHGSAIQRQTMPGLASAGSSSPAYLGRNQALHASQAALALSPLPSPDVYSTPQVHHDSTSSLPAVSFEPHISSDYDSVAPSGILSDVSLDYDEGSGAFSSQGSGGFGPSPVSPPHLRELF